MEKKVTGKRYYSAPECLILDVGENTYLLRLEGDYYYNTTSYNSAPMRDIGLDFTARRKLAAKHWGVTLDNISGDWPKPTDVNKDIQNECLTSLLNELQGLIDDYNLKNYPELYSESAGGVDLSIIKPRRIEI